MKYFVTAALAAALMGAAAAAQADNPRDDQHKTEARPAHAAAPRAERSAPTVERSAPRTERTAPTVERGAPRTERTATRAERTTTRTERTAPRTERTTTRTEHATARTAETTRTRTTRATTTRVAGAGGHGFHSHALRPADRGRAYYSASRFQARYVSTRHFHYSGGHPSGWYARAWVFGQILPVGWYAPEYYLDYGNYDLPQPPIGCEWVQEGSDAVLVDIWTGQVLSVYSDVFD
ncbi:MAG TPA: RcnB family protein [Streptosporangiaceae bacterium]|nr:RcnB family protein [Streptosporangiaceae bacterium]